MSPPVRKLAIFLGVSVGLNLFLLGMLSVQFLHHRRPVTSSDGPWGHPHLLFHAGEVFEGDLSRAGRILHEHKKALREHRRAVREARREARSVLESEPFDKGALETQLSRLRTHTQGSQEILHRAFVELATEATPEQRRRLSRWADGPRGPRHTAPPHGPPPHGPPSHGPRLFRGQGGGEQE